LCTVLEVPFKNAPRLETFDYIGSYRYFLTICVADRQRVFIESETVDLVLSQLRQSSGARHFSVIAYCFMPDHLHLLVEGLTEDADLKNFVRIFKQQSSFAWLQTRQQPLWQRSYFDRVLRDSDDSITIVRYILDNPVRAGLVDSPEKYQFLGSLAVELKDLLESVMRT
jgi:putative transposase